MSSATLVRPETPTVTRHRLTFARVVLSEWIKFRTLRSSWLTLGAAMAALVVIGTLIGYNTGKNFDNLAPEDAAASGVLQGYYLGQLLIGVLGVLFVSGEYTTGMIRSTLAAVPRRTPVLLAKALVFAAVALVAMTIASVTAFLSGQAFLRHYGHGTSLSEPTVLRAVLGLGVYLALIGLLGGALGWIVRSTPGGISALVALLMVLPVLFRVLPGSFFSTAMQYLPGTAGGSFVTTVRLPDTLAPWTGITVLAGWVAVALCLAAVRLKRRDG